MKTRMKTEKKSLVVLIAVVSFFCSAVSSFAVDGKIEISQTSNTTFPIRINDPQLPNSYILTSNIRGMELNYNAIVITVPNILLDLNGYSIIGPYGNGTGIGIQICADNVEIINGTVRDFGADGISKNCGIFGLKKHKVIGVKAINNGRNGISLGDNSVVKNCEITGNGQNSTDFVNTAGLKVQQQSIIEGNTVSDNTFGGIMSGVNSVIEKNIVISNGTSGITTVDSVIARNQIGKNGTFNGGGGIYVSGSGSPSTTIVENFVFDNTGTGIFAGFGAIIGNTVRNNGNGISGSGLISRNVSEGNVGVGISVWGSSTVTNNFTSNNGSSGIYIGSGFSGSFVDSNTAVDNGLPNMSSCSNCTFGTNHAP